MIAWYKFKKAYPPQQRMDRYTTIYAVNSLVADVVYAFAGDQMAVIDSERGVCADFEDVPKLIAQTEDEEFKKEFTAIYQDIKDLGIRRRQWT